MKFGSNYAGLRIPFGDPLRVIQFRFGVYETSNPDEIEVLNKHSETFVLGGDADGNSGDGNKKAKPSSKSRNTRKRSGDGKSTN